MREQVDDLPESGVFLRSEASSGRFFTGGQLYVSLGGRVLSDIGFGVDGAGRPVSPSTLGSAYCATKPLVACALAVLLDRAALPFSTTVADVLPEYGELWFGEVSIAEVMTHTAGFHQEEPVVIGMLTPEARQKLVATSRPPDGWMRKEDLGYSSYGGWHVLGLAIERLSGKGFADAVEELVVSPLGLDGELFSGMSDEQFEAHRSRVGVNVHVLPSGPVPLLVERTEVFCRQWNPGFGGYASSRGLGRFYEQVLGALRGDGRDGWLCRRTVEQMTSGQSGWRYDDVMDRPCQYGFGFMVDMRAHHFGERCSARSFGHTGNVGFVAAFAEPETDLVVAVRCNGVIEDRDLAFELRETLFGKLYEEVASARPSSMASSGPDAR
jgi:CubicO group peptidase (beta-lactamase class C family)